MHNAQGRKVLTLDTMGGLVTIADDNSVPSGASPRNNDVDFEVGEVHTRPPLIGVFDLHGQDFTAIPTSNVALAPSPGALWTTPENIVSTTRSATVTVAQTNDLGLVVPRQVYQSGPTNFGAVTPQPGITNGPSAQFVVQPGQSLTANIDATGFIPPASYPVDSILNGIVGQIVAGSMNLIGPATITLTFAGGPLSDSYSVSFPFLLNGPNEYSIGEPDNITDDTVTVFDAFTRVSTAWQGFQLLVAVTGLSCPEDSPFPGILNLNSAVEVVYYTQANVSQTISSTNLVLAIPALNRVNGFLASVTASGRTLLNAQLTLNGAAVGSVKSVPAPQAPSAVTFGGPNDLWDIPAEENVHHSTITGWSISAGIVTFIGGNLFSVGDLIDVNGLASGNGLGLNRRGYRVVAANGSQWSAKSPSLQNYPLTGDGGGAFYAVDVPINAGQVNGSTFGVNIWVSTIAKQENQVASLQNLSLTIYTEEQFRQFRYVKTYQREDGYAQTLTLDTFGEVWKEDLQLSPGSLSPLFSGIATGAYGKSTSFNDREFMCFSDLTQGIDQPRQYTPQGWIDRVTQVGPGAPPTFQASSTVSGTVSISSYATASGVTTLQGANNLQSGDIVSFAGMVSATSLNGKTYTVLGQSLSNTEFSIAAGLADSVSTADSGVATQVFSYPLTSITQPPQKSDIHKPGFFQQLLWSSGPGSETPGTTITVYYQNEADSPTPDTDLVNAFNTGDPVYVFVTNTPFGAGTWLVTGVGSGTPPGADGPRFYFTYSVPTSAFQYSGSDGDGASGTYNRTLATIVVSTPVPGLGVGDTISLQGVTPNGWNQSWEIQQALDSGSLVITTSSLSSGAATYGFTVSTGVAPTAGQLVTITGTLNANGELNGQGLLIASVSGSTFVVDGFPTGTFAQQGESGQATTAGTTYTIEPGLTTVGTTASPIYGNATNGFLSLGSGPQKIGSGTRQGVVIFQTRNGALTAPSAPVTFTTPDDTENITITNIPIGPPTTVARIIAFTEAGANGVPGAFFYYIPNPVVNVVEGVTVTSDSTVIQDNSTTSATFTFTDATLLAATEIDVQGADLFNQIELGNPAWNVSYRSRMFYGLCQSKIQNFTNLTFDGGFIRVTGGNPGPLGWGLNQESSPLAGMPVSIGQFQIVGNVVTFEAANSFPIGVPFYITGMQKGTYLNGVALMTITGTNANQIVANFVHANVSATVDSGVATQLNIGGELQVSPIFGNSYLISNSSGSTQAAWGMLTQSADRDAYQQPILLPNVPYSVRIVARSSNPPSPGTLPPPQVVIDVIGVVDGAYTAQLGEFSLDIGNLTATMATHTGPLIPSEPQVPAGCLLRLYARNIPNGVSVELDRMEIFPTLQPIDATTVYGSYVLNPEGVDGVSGKIGVNQQNPQPVNGAAVMYDQMYLLKTSSMYSTQDDDQSEPSGWIVHEVSNRVGTIGPNSYDVGEEWLMTACRNGLFGFNGGQPQLLSSEIKEVWNAIAWQNGNSIWVKNDIVNRRAYIGVPLPFPNTWVPNPLFGEQFPTLPNAVLLLNYTGCDSFGDLVNAPQMHTTVTGSLTALDMRRKWSIWQVRSPYAEFVLRSGGLAGSPDSYSLPLLLCNGIGDSQIYQLGPTGAGWDYGDYPIQASYATYGFGSGGDEQIVGPLRKRFVYMTGTVDGSGTLSVLVTPNTIKANGYSVPNGIPLAAVMQNEFERPINIAGNRVFITLSTVNGSFFSCSRLALIGMQDSWAPIRGVAQ